MKRAFTLLELIIVIVVIGILAAVIFPRIGTDSVERAAKDILEHIRYTQHLAMVDDKYDPSDPNCYKEYWQIRFFRRAQASADGTTSKWAYAIFSDKNGGSGYDGNPNATTGEVALDPITKKLLSGGFTIAYSDQRTYKPAAIEETYGITNVIFSSSCSYYGSKRVVYDPMGRPLKGNPQTYGSLYPTNRIIKQQCTIDFCFNSTCDKNFTIAINQETGFAYIKSLNP